MIQVSDLVKRYGSHLAVDRVSFSARPGEVLGLLGPNGAGKSTVMRILSGYLSASEGSATVAGFDVGSASFEVRRRLGYLPETPGLYLELRVEEYLAYRATVKGLGVLTRRRRIDRALEICGLTGVRRRIIGQLSKGYRQRVSLAAALVHEPPVVILDEPTVGLDPNQMREIRALVRELGKDRTVLFSTHIMSEAEAVCDRVVIIDRGKVLADSPPRELSRRSQAQSLILEFEGEADAALSSLRAIAGIELEVLQQLPTTRLRVVAQGAPDRATRAELSRAVTRSGAVLLELSMESATLDEVFARLTSEGAAG